MGWYRHANAARAMWMHLFIGHKTYLENIGNEMRWGAVYIVYIANEFVLNLKM